MIFLKDIDVKYSYKTVLDKISLSFEENKIYSLLGENGAGKSTLAKVLCGDLTPTGGEIFLNNQKVCFNTPHDAIEKGIVCVHQRPLLAHSVTIKENLLLGQKKINLSQAQELLKEWLPEYNFKTSVKSLLQEETFFVSLTGALLRSPSFLILDEPPFIAPEKLRNLAQNGMTVVIITHNLSEALEKSDKVILLKDGHVLEEKDSTQITEQEIKQKLFGISKEIKMPDFIKTESITEKQVLALHSKSIKQRYKDKEKRITGYIPSDKTFTASNPNLTVFQLATAYHTEESKAALEAYAKKLLDKSEVNIKLYEKAFCLSGGMLQRLILEREIAENPEELYLFNPTKGLDAEGTEKLYSKLKALSDKGTKIILGISDVEKTA